MKKLSYAVGRAVQWSIQKAVAAIGRSVDLAHEPWLDGPIGDTSIGPAFYQRFVETSNLHLHEGSPGAGLLPKFDQLAGRHFDPQRVHPAVRHFYEHTAAYEMDVWSQWNGIFSPFAHLLVSLVSPIMDQFNVPLTPLATSKGISSEILQFLDDNQIQRFAGWLRRDKATGAVIYAGFYTICVPPVTGDPCVKVVFPVPNGATTVVFRPQNTKDGALMLFSHGTRFGSPGFYRLHRSKATTTGCRVRVAYFPLHEVFRVYVADDKSLRTDHTLYFAGIKFLTLHYRLRQSD